MNSVVSCKRLNVNEREDVQEKTFTKWINAQLNRRNIKPVKDLFKDLRDGRVLIQLMEILTNTSLKPEIGKLRVHHIGNVNKTLDLLRDYGIRLINVNSNDIVDGNKKLTLALIWAVILTWQVKSVLQKVHPNCNFETIEKTLVTWCRDQTIGYKKVKIQDFSSSWKDGLAFNALLHRKNPNLFDYDLLIDRQPNENLEHAFKIAKENYGVDQYLDVEDFINGEPDKKSIMVYVMSLLECDSISKHQWLESRNDNKHEFELFVYNANQLMDLLRNAMIGCTIELNEDIDRRFLKESYHSREVFMQHISSLEEQTTEVKRLADQFASDSTLSSTENNEANYIQQMVVDLWRKLKLRVDEYNKSLHRLFISDQITVLEELESWVQQTEEQITRLSGALSYPSEYKSELQQNLHTLRLLERAMQSKQSDVSELESMLKSSSIYEDDDKNYIDDDLRKRITKLTDNWCTIARFVENNLITAQENLIYIKEMDEELAHCERWLNDKERCLNEISHANTDDEAQAKIAMLKINVICKEADFIKTILEKMTSKQSESTTSDHEKGCNVNAILTSVLRFKERRQRISSECERLSSCIRRGYVRKGKNNEIKAFNTEAANHNQMTEEDRITYVEKVRSSFYSECTRVLNWLEEVEAILDGQAFQELDSHKQYSALTELIQKFNRYNRDFSELSRIGENLQTLLTDTNEMENVSNMHTDIKERWLHLEDKVNQIRKNASLKIDESYVRNELQPVEDGVNDLSRLYLSNETQVDGEQIKPKEHAKTIRIYQERIEYLQKLLYNMEKEHGQGSANSLNALLANCKQKFNAVQIKIAKPSCCLVKLIQRNKAVRKQNQFETKQIGES
ncbi:hypothetical protein GJ496_000267 [Pomphorhynchus laevis]|nr:hypothetical protein GJ496_000267 [Pomphorhynchus laevis]